MTATVKQLEIQIDDIIKHIQDLTQVVMHLQSVVQQLEAGTLAATGADKIVAYERGNSYHVDIDKNYKGQISVDIVAWPVDEDEKVANS